MWDMDRNMALHSRDADTANIIKLTKTQKSVIEEYFILPSQSIHIQHRKNDENQTMRNQTPRRQQNQDKNHAPQSQIDQDTQSVLYTRKGARSYINTLLRIDDAGLTLWSKDTSQRCE